MDKGINYIMHIPKTAGMTLQNLIRLRYKNENELFLVYDQKANKFGFKNSNSLKIVMGHFRFGYHHFSNRPFRYFTFLRNPVDHIISHYHYTFDHPEKFIGLPKNIKNIIDFVMSPYGYNLQTRFISGINDIQGREKEALNLAKENLKTHFEFIGITEDFDTSLVMLAQKLNWKLFFFKNYNEGKARKIASPTSEEIKRIKDLNCYDEDLYLFACKLYEMQKGNYQNLDFQVKLFKFTNKWFWKLNPIYTQFKVRVGLVDTQLFKKKK